MSGFNQIKQVVQKGLEPFGFLMRDKSTLYRVTMNGWLQFVNFQWGTGFLKNKCTVNIVLQGLFCPGASFDVLQPGGRISNFQAASKDIWWSYESEAQALESGQDILRCLINDVLPLFDLLAKECDHLALLTQDRYKFLWWGTNSFVLKGFLQLRFEKFAEAIKTFDLKPSQVPKYKTICSLVESGDSVGVQEILVTNIASQRKSLNI